MYGLSKVGVPKNKLRNVDSRGRRYFAQYLLTLKPGERSIVERQEWRKVSADKSFPYYLNKMYGDRFKIVDESDDIYVVERTGEEIELITESPLWEEQEQEDISVKCKKGDIWYSIGGNVLVKYMVCTLAERSVTFVQVDIGKQRHRIDARNHLVAIGTTLFQNGNPIFPATRSRDRQYANQAAIEKIKRLEKLYGTLFRALRTRNGEVDFERFVDLFQETYNKAALMFNINRKTVINEKQAKAGKISRPSYFQPNIYK